MIKLKKILVKLFLKDADKNFAFSFIANQNLFLKDLSGFRDDENNLKI